MKWNKQRLLSCICSMHLQFPVRFQYISVEQLCSSSSPHTSAVFPLLRSAVQGWNREAGREGEKLSFIWDTVWCICSSSGSWANGKKTCACAHLQWKNKSHNDGVDFVQQNAQATDVLQDVPTIIHTLSLCLDLYPWRNQQHYGFKQDLMIPTIQIKLRLIVK